MSLKPYQVVYQLKITLRGAKPPIWRRVLVPDNMTLLTLHESIQCVMGWTNTHLAEFEDPEGDLYPLPEPFGVSGDLACKTTILNQVLTTKNDYLNYVYDFGDNWEHKILLEKCLERNDVKNGLPVCIKAVGACPWEESGGIWEYSEKLEILKDPTHPDYEELMEWRPVERFDPKYVDMEKINQDLNRYALV